MRAIIIDDEINIINGLSIMLDTHCQEISIVGTGESVNKAIELIDGHKPDIVFLDIKIKGGTGLDVLNSVGYEDFQVIFITAYNEYAIRAFDFSAIAYLLKPVDSDELIKAVKKAAYYHSLKRDSLQLQVLKDNLNPSASASRKMIISNKDIVHSVLLSNILYFEADGSYCRIITTEKNIYTSKNLKRYEELLNGLGFVRAHHSYLFNIAHLKSYDRLANELHLTAGHVIPVSLRKKEKLLSILKTHLA